MSSPGLEYSSGDFHRLKQAMIMIVDSVQVRNPGLVLNGRTKCVHPVEPDL